MNERFDSRAIRAAGPPVVARDAKHVCVLYVDGALRAPLDGVLRDRVQDLLRRGVQAIVLDLSRVRAIDAAGVGQLVRLYNLMIAAEGELRIAHATPLVREMLERAGLFNLLSAGRE